MTAILAKPLPTSYDSIMRPHAPLHDSTVTNASREHAYSRNHTTPGIYGKKVVRDATTKPFTVEHGHLRTSRLLYVPGRGRRRDVARENQVPSSQQSVPPAPRHWVAADNEQHKPNAFEEDINPFIDPDNDTEWDLSSEESRSNTALSLESISFSLNLDADAIPQEEETFVYTPQSAASLLPDRSDRRERIPSGERKAAARVRRHPWNAPGPSPLSQASDIIIGDQLSSHTLSQSDMKMKDVSVGHRSLRIRALPRTLAGKHRGRVSISLRHNFLLRTLLRRIYSLDIESPELDFVDADSIEFFLDLQIGLIRGFVAIPSLSPYVVANRSPFGTPRRRMQWKTGQTFPRRLEDYGRAATRLLARKRIVYAHQEGI